MWVEKPCGIGAFSCKKAAIFIYCNRTTVLTDLGRKTRAIAISAAPIALRRATLVKKTLWNPRLSRDVEANPFRKPEDVISCELEAARKPTAAEKRRVRPSISLRKATMSLRAFRWEIRIV
jgi:hypothetical protein